MLVGETQNNSLPPAFLSHFFPVLLPAGPVPSTRTCSSFLLGVRLSFSLSLSSTCPRPETSVLLRGSQSHRPTSSAHTAILRRLSLHRHATWDVGLTQQLFAKAQLIPSQPPPPPADSHSLVSPPPPTSADSHSLVWPHHCPFSPSLSSLRIGVLRPALSSHRILHLSLYQAFHINLESRHSPLTCLFFTHLSVCIRVRGIEHQTHPPRLVPSNPRTQLSCFLHVSP